MEVGLLFAKNGFLALNKPAGMCTWNKTQKHSSNIPQLWEMIQMRHKRGWFAHRIDRFTSGINLAGVSEYQVRYLMSNWHNITKKYYLAIIENPTWEMKIVDTPVNDGESATTKFTVLERSNLFALVQCQLVEHGRTHQIRQHLQSIGFPILGDTKYNGQKVNAREGQLLHAWRIEFKLPGSSYAWTSVQAPIPSDFKEFNFPWNRWNFNASPVLETWEVPTNWRR